eukprot:scaffold1766_cov401-Prasinococcus_capsulatus_cf.AAC.35
MLSLPLQCLALLAVWLALPNASESLAGFGGFDVEANRVDSVKSWSSQAKPDFRHEKGSLISEIEAEYARIVTGENPKDEAPSKYAAAEMASSDSVPSEQDEDLYYIDHKGRRRKKGVGSMTRGSYHKLIRSSRWFNPDVSREYELDWWSKRIEFDDRNADRLSELMEERRSLNLQREDNIFFIRTGQSEVDLKVFPRYTFRPDCWDSRMAVWSAAALVVFSGIRSNGCSNGWSQRYVIHLLVRIAEGVGCLIVAHPCRSIHLCP